MQHLIFLQIFFKHKLSRSSSVIYILKSYEIPHSAGECKPDVIDCRSHFSSHRYVSSFSPISPLDPGRNGPHGTIYLEASFQCPTTSSKRLKANVQSFSRAANQCALIPGTKEQLVLLTFGKTMHGVALNQTNKMNRNRKQYREVQILSAQYMTGQGQQQLMFSSINRHSC